MERVLDAVVATEKAPLVGADLSQVKGRQRQTPCGRREQDKLPTAKDTRSTAEEEKGPRQSAEVSHVRLWRRDK